MGISNLDVLQADRLITDRLEIPASGLMLSSAVVTLSTNTTLDATHANTLLLAGAADLVLTLPATVAGRRYLIALAAAGLSAGTGLSISPNAADRIIGNGFTPADDKDAILAGAGDRAGDLIEITGDGDLGWYITRVIGTWTREA